MSPRNLWHNWRLVEDLGIDLGTANIVVYARGRGIVLREPSVVAVDARTKRVQAVGEEARLMLGRTPGTIVAKRPLRDGVIADYSITREMLAYLIAKACGRRARLLKPTAVICIPSGATNVEKRAALDAARAAGARRAIPIEEPMAAAIGAGLPIDLPGGNMVVDIGGGTTDIAVISLGGIVISDSLRVGGNRLDEAIIRHVRRTYNLDIGEPTSENIKIEIGSAVPIDPEQELDVKGRDIVSGLPKVVPVSSVEVREAMQESIAQIVASVKLILEQTPPNSPPTSSSVARPLPAGAHCWSAWIRCSRERRGCPWPLLTIPSARWLWGRARCWRWHASWTHATTSSSIRTPTTDEPAGPTGHASPVRSTLSRRCA